MEGVRLRINTADGAKKEIPVLKPEFVVGRGRKADIQLQDSAVSRRHLRIVKRDDNYFLEDLGSTNGTFLNGRRIRTRRLRDGDEFYIGHTSLRFLLLNGTGRAKVTVGEGRQVHEGPLEAAASSGTGPGLAFIKVLRGPGQGQTKPVDENFYSISDPRGEMMVISRRATGYWLLRLGGGTTPVINGRFLDAGGAQLHDGDIVEFGGYRLRMLIPSEGLVEQAQARR